MFPGIVARSCIFNFFVAGSLLFAYKSGMIKPDQNFLLMVFAGNYGYLSLLLIHFIYSLFSGSTPEIFSGSGNFSIGISLFVVAIAALNLVLDFDIIEQVSRTRCSKVYGILWINGFNGYINLALY